MCSGFENHVLGFPSLAFFRPTLACNAASMSTTGAAAARAVGMVAASPMAFCSMAVSGSRDPS